jgi:hypothetical protein
MYSLSHLNTLNRVIPKGAFGENEWLCNRELTFIGDRRPYVEHIAV